METLTSLQTLYAHLICSKSGDYYPKDQLQTYSRLGKPLLACYDLAAGLDRQTLAGRPFDMWRYRELLPVEAAENRVSLGEGGTPLSRLERLESCHGFHRLFLKDEAFNPTASFKARGLAVAVSKALELGVHTCVIPTAGNAGGALSAYCARAGLGAHVFMPRQTPSLFRKECELFGARVTLVDGTIADCARLMRRDMQPGWFDVSTLKEPFRLEGKKTMGFEIAEQLGWELPDVIVYPTGGGTGLIGIWKAFSEMAQLGWTGPRRPRMVAVQSVACCPIVEAFRRGSDTAAHFDKPGLTIANGLRVPAAFGDELILKTIYDSRGTALAVSDEELRQGLAQVARQEGILLAPEGAAVWIAARRLRGQGWIKAQESVVLLNTGSWYKYAENF